MDQLFTVRRGQEAPKFGNMFQMVESCQVESSDVMLEVRLASLISPRSLTSSLRFRETVDNMDINFFSVKL